MSNVALFNDMRDLHVNSICDAMTRVGMLHDESVMQLKQLIETGTNPAFNIWRVSGAESIAIEWPGSSLILYKDASGKIEDKVTYNKELVHAEIEQMFGVFAISVSGEVVCLLPINYIK